MYKYLICSCEKTPTIIYMVVKSEQITVPQSLGILEHIKLIFLSEIVKSRRNFLCSSLHN